MLGVFVSVFANVKFLGAFLESVTVIFLGFVFMKKGFVDKAGKKTISVLIWKLAVPCFAFNAFMQDFDPQIFRAALVEIVLAVIFYLILILVGKLAFLRRGKDVSTVSSLFAAIGQTTLFSMPILQSVYQDSGRQVMIYISGVSIVFRIFVYIVGYQIISGGQKERKKGRLGAVGKVFLNPVMIGMFLGMAVFLLQNVTPSLNLAEINEAGQEVSVSYSIFRLDKSLPVVYGIMKTLGNLVSPLCMFMIGMSLGEARILDCLKDSAAWIIALLRNVAGPVIVSLLCLLIHRTGLFHFDEYSLATIVIAFSAPVSVTLSLMCTEFHREEVLASRSCVISTLMTLVTFPLSFVLVHVVLRFLG